ncbi:MAG: nuclear transport factor 2 family protein [Actinomycetota bacterium]|nr:nuclear transport factor 2 family protein [Actinomycetota bacterium]
MATLDDTRAVYGRAWLTKDPDERRRLLEECFAEDGLFVDPTGPVIARGRQALFQHISGLWGDTASLEHQVGSGSSIRVEAVGRVEENLDGWFRFRFRWHTPEGQTVMMGTDFGRVSADGRFELIVVFIDPIE